MLDRHPDQISGSREAKLVFHGAAIIRHGLVAEANRIRDLHQAVAFAEEPEYLKIAACQLFKSMPRRRIREAFEQRAGQVPGRFLAQ